MGYLRVTGKQSIVIFLIYKSMGISIYAYDNGLVRHRIAGTFKIWMHLHK